MSITAKFGQGKLVNISRQDDGSIVFDRGEKSNKVRVIPSTDVNGMIYEEVDASGNMLFRGSFDPFQTIAFLTYIHKLETDATVIAVDDKK